MKPGFFVVATALAAAFGMAPADAAPVMNTTYGGRVYGGTLPSGINVTGPGTWSGTGLTVTISPTPTMTISADQSIPYSYGSPGVSTDSAYVTYEFEYMYNGSGSPDGSIPVSFHVILDASDCSGAGPTYCGTAGASFNVDSGAYLESIFCNVGVSTECASVTDAHVDHIVTLLLSPNSVHTVTLAAATQGFGPAHAEADPYMFIDPSFGNAADYQLLLPAGVGNSNTPEPGTYLLVALGGLGAAFARARGGRKRKGAQELP